MKTKPAYTVVIVGRIRDSLRWYACTSWWGRRLACAVARWSDLWMMQPPTSVVESRQRPGPCWPALSRDAGVAAAASDAGKAAEVAAAVTSATWGAAARPSPAAAVRQSLPSDRRRSTGTRRARRRRWELGRRWRPWDDRDAGDYDGDCATTGCGVDERSWRSRPAQSTEMSCYRWCRAASASVPYWSVKTSWRRWARRRVTSDAAWWPRQQQHRRAALTALQDTPSTTINQFLRWPK